MTSTSKQVAKGHLAACFDYRVQGQGHRAESFLLHLLKTLIWLAVSMVEDVGDAVRQD